MSFRTSMFAVLGDLETGKCIASLAQELSLPRQPTNGAGVTVACNRCLHPSIQILTFSLLVELPCIGLQDASIAENSSSASQAID